MMIKYFINTFNGCVLPRNSFFTMAVNSSIVCVGSKYQLHLFSFLATDLKMALWNRRLQELTVPLVLWDSVLSSS